METIRGRVMNKHEKLKCFTKYMDCRKKMIGANYSYFEYLAKLNTSNLLSYKLEGQLPFSSYNAETGEWDNDVIDIDCSMSNMSEIKDQFGEILRTSDENFVEPETDLGWYAALVKYIEESNSDIKFDIIDARRPDGANILPISLSHMANLSDHFGFDSLDDYLESLDSNSDLNPKFNFSSHLSSFNAFREESKNIINHYNETCLNPEMKITKSEVEACNQKAEQEFFAQKNQTWKTLYQQGLAQSTHDAQAKKIQGFSARRLFNPSKQVNSFARSINIGNAFDDVDSDFNEEKIDDKEP